MFLAIIGGFVFVLGAKTGDQTSIVVGLVLVVIGAMVWRDG